MFASSSEVDRLTFLKHYKLSQYAKTEDVAYIINSQQLKTLSEGNAGIIKQLKVSGIMLCLKMGKITKVHNQVRVDSDLAQEYKKMAQIKQKIDSRQGEKSRLAYACGVAMCNGLGGTARFGVLLDNFEHGSLQQYLYDKIIPPNVIHQMMMDMIAAVQQLHSIHFIHGDIACRNFLVSKALRLHLTDFGSSGKSSSFKVSGHGVLADAFTRPRVEGEKLPTYHMAPEILESWHLFDLPYTKAGDVYMVGCSILELLQRARFRGRTYFPFEDMSDGNKEWLASVKKTRYNEEISNVVAGERDNQKVRNLISSMICPVSKRLPINAARLLSENISVRDVQVGMQHMSDEMALAQTSLLSLNKLCCI